MKILIIEDDELKLEKLTEHLNNTAAQHTYTIKKSLKSGLREACLNKYNVIILDMSLPTFEISRNENGGRFNSFGGQEILHELKRRNIRTQSIIFTQFESFGEQHKEISLDSLKLQLQNYFTGMYLGTVFYNAANTDWQNKLDELLSSIITKECPND